MKYNIILILICLKQMVFGQQAITLNQALKMAVENNLSLKSDKLYKVYTAQMSKVNGNFSNTNIASQLGQVNSAYFDNQFSIQQNISFPKVYTTQRMLNKSIYESSLYNYQLKECELKKQVSQTYYEIHYLLAKKNLLLSVDSIYQEFILKSENRLKNGETEILEKVLAETQKGQINIQLSQAINDLDIALLRFKFLLNTDLDFLFNIASEEQATLTSMDSFDVANFSYIRYLKNDQLTTKYQQQIEKNKLMPDLMFSFYTMTMKGAGADNKFYNYDSRFNSVQVGLSIPLLFGPQMKKIKAIGSLQLLAENNLQLGMKNITKEFESSKLNYENTFKVFKYYQTKGLLQADLIVKNANIKYSSGEINYINWVYLFNECINIKSQYLDALYNLNKAIVELNYYTNK